MFSDRLFVTLHLKYKRHDMIKSLFFDIDGTLVSFKTHEIPQSTVNAIAQAKAKGVGIYISTGRPLSIINNLKAIEPYIDGYITTNGALCLVEGTTVCCNPIPEQDVKTLIHDADVNDYTVLVVGEKDVRLYNPKPIFHEVFYQQLNVTTIDTTLPAMPVIQTQRILQFTPFFPESHEAQLMEQLPGCVSGRWHPAFTDITAREADKGKGLMAMAHYLGLDPSETMAFGDGGNDVAILRQAGIGVAMGNAGTEARLAADYVTTSVDDDGVLNALKYFHVI